MRQEHLKLQHPNVEEIQPNNVEVQQHIHDLLQEKNNGDMQPLHLEMQQQRAVEVHPHNGEVQPNVIDLLQHKNKGEVQQKTKYATLKERPSRRLNHLPTTLKYAFLGNTKNLTCQCKILVDISHMLNTMKYEVRKLWDPG
ncbi:hypothetical protein PIB30_092938, partial [Stylosanthes scabra]|nr:hypothetical protein [Stylosanthes scabra]